jgi:tropomyosin-1
MDAIKKKMQSLANETASATSRAQKWENEVNRINDSADHYEEQVKNYQKKIQNLEGRFDQTTEDLFNQTIKLEGMEKKAGNAEGQVGDLARRLLLLEDNAINSETRLAVAITNLAKMSINADKSVKVRHEMEQECARKSENNDGLEQQLKDAQYTLTESENKFETIARKLATVEAEAERSNERAELVETKFIDIEDELKIVGHNQQTLEVSEEQALLREEKLQKQIKELMAKLKIADTRSENSEMDIQRLNVRIDKIEEDLVLEKMKIKNVSDDLNHVFDEMLYV